MLGVSSANTVKNWLEGGWFPGAFQTAGGHWRFPLNDVGAVRLRLEGLRDRKSNRELSPVDDAAFFQDRFDSGWAMEWLAWRLGMTVSRLVLRAAASTSRH